MPIIFGFTLTLPEAFTSKHLSQKCIKADLDIEQKQIRLSWTNVWVVMKKRKTVCSVNRGTKQTSAYRLCMEECPCRIPNTYY